MMHRISRPTRLVAAILTLALAACGDGDTDSARNTDNVTGADDAFCSAMKGVATRMSRDTGLPTPPSALRVDFGEVVTLLDQAQQNAPAAISDDVTAFAVAIDAYVVALEKADYDLGTIFSTREGTQLAEDTSHALTPDVINFMTGPCDITLE
jgi:hypothetical protein